MFNQNKFKKNYISSIVFTILSVIALIWTVVCLRALYSLADSVSTGGILGVVSVSFIMFVLFMIFCISAIVFSTLSSGFSILFIKRNYRKKANILILIFNIICFVAEMVLLILIFADSTLVIPPYV